MLSNFSQDEPHSYASRHLEPDGHAPGFVKLLFMFALFVGLWFRYVHASPYSFQLIEHPHV